MKVFIFFPKNESINLTDPKLLNGSVHDLLHRS